MYTYGHIYTPQAHTTCTHTHTTMTCTHTYYTHHKHTYTHHNDMHTYVHTHHMHTYRHVHTPQAHHTCTHVLYTESLHARLTWTIDNLWLSSMQHLPNLPGHQSLPTTCILKPHPHHRVSNHTLYVRTHLHIHLQYCTIHSKNCSSTACTYTVRVAEHTVIHKSPPPNCCVHEHFISFHIMMQLKPRVPNKVCKKKNRINN